MAVHKRTKAVGKTSHEASKALTSVETGVRLVNGRVIGPTLADPGMDKKVHDAERRLFPNRQAAIDHFHKRGVLTANGNLTKAYGG
jgi:hypothetical protein